MRRLCKKCVTSRPATDDEIGVLPSEYIGAFPSPRAARHHEAVLAEWLSMLGHDEPLKFHHAPGCLPALPEDGPGRRGLHELLSVDQGCGT